MTKTKVENFSMYWHHLECLLKHSFWFSRSGWDRAQVHAFLRCFQVMMQVLVLGPHFDNHCNKPTYRILKTLLKQVLWVTEEKQKTHLYEKPRNSWKSKNANLTAPQKRPKIFLWVSLSQKKMHSKCLEEAKKNTWIISWIGCHDKKKSRRNRGI